jgi:hypothetical protein
MNLPGFIDKKTGGIMSINFKIISKQNDGDLHIDMLGDFDGSSACELANIIKMKYPGTGRIFINIRNLSRINQFGSAVMENLIAVQGLPVDSMVFIGEAETIRGQSGCALSNINGHNCGRCNGNCRQRSSKI